MADRTPVLDYFPADQARLPGLAWQSTVALALLLLTSVTPCACGHLDWLSLAFAGPSAGLSWWGYTRKTRPGPYRVLMAVLVVLSTLAVLKCFADILWYGHNPLLG